MSIRISPSTKLQTNSSANPASAMNDDLFDPLGKEWRAIDAELPDDLHPYEIAKDATETKTSRNRSP